MKKKLLFVGDAACPSGFARATHEILDATRYTYDITVLGINYRGDPHSYPYPIYAAWVGGDALGVSRLIWMCDAVKPDIIVLQNDPWHIPAYLAQLRRVPEYAGIPVVAAVAVDGKNCLGVGLNGLAHAIFWTQFGLDEAREGGYTGNASVIPLGVDLDMYKPSSRLEARNRRLPTLGDAFIIGNVNRNQPRKRWDLTIRYFAEWVKSKKIDDAYLYLHVAPTGDAGMDVKRLMQYYGVLDRLALLAPQVWYGIPEQEMADTYNCFDLMISTTQGEGMGLTTMEAMACGVPCIVPDWAALGEWAKGAAWMVPCTSTCVGAPIGNMSVIGGVPDEEKFIQALDAMYHNPHYRETNSRAGLERMQQARFRWSNIGKAWVQALSKVLEPAHGESPAISEKVWEDLGRPVEVVV